MDSLSIFGLQFLLSVIVFGLLAKWYVAPWIATQPRRSALALLILPHTLRHVGMAFLVPGLVAPGIASPFATAAAYGDLASGLLAILAMFALRADWKLAIPIVWVFNLTGTFDLLNALRQAEVVPYLLSTWYIPTFVVPVLLVTHAMVFHALFCPASSASRDEVRSTSVSARA